MRKKINAGQLSIYLLLWLILTFLLLFMIYDFNAPFLQQYIATLIVTGFTGLPAYISSKLLVPRLLYHKLIGKFVLALLVTALLNTVITYFLAGGFYYKMSGKSIFTSNAVIQTLSIYFFIVNCIVMVVSSAVQIIVDRFRIERHLHEVENEKESTELAFLRSQINPHFLFNVLNTIYFQVNKDNLDARNSIEKLSEMLRYQLYECTTDMIHISRELAYIENYVAVQQLRMEEGTDLQIKLPQDTVSFKIAPLLILPLVENAFKHISNFKDPSLNKLYINIYIEHDNRFVVNVLNSYCLSDKGERTKKSNGLGLQNLERRLELLYPGKHLLVKECNEHTYETTLSIQYRD